MLHFAKGIKPVSRCHEAKSELDKLWLQRLLCWHAILVLAVLAQQAGLRRILQVRQPEHLGAKQKHSGGDGLQLVASLLLVEMPGATSSFLLLAAMPLLHLVTTSDGLRSKKD